MHAGRHKCRPLQNYHKYTGEHSSHLHNKKPLRMKWLYILLNSVADTLAS